MAFYWLCFPSFNAVQNIKRSQTRLIFVLFAFSVCLYLVRVLIQNANLSRFYSFLLWLCRPVPPATRAAPILGRSGPGQFTRTRPDSARSVLVCPVPAAVPVSVRSRRSAPLRQGVSVPACRHCPTCLARSALFCFAHDAKQSTGHPPFTFTGRPVLKRASQYAPTAAPSTNPPRTFSWKSRFPDKKATRHVVGYIFYF